MAQVFSDPCAADSAVPVNPAHRLDDVSGKSVGLVDNSKVNADLFLESLAGILNERFGVAVEKPIRKAAPKDPLKETDLVSLQKCDAVIQCFGDCGTSTSISVADAVELERRGVPTVTVFSTAFANAAKAQAAGRGLSNLPLVTIPHPMHTAPSQLVKERATVAAELVVAQLTGSGVAEVAAENAKAEGGRAIPASVNDDEQELFYARGWSDGLPVVGPTHERVRQMLSATSLAPQEIVGEIPPRWRTATVEKIAVNAVLAGCKPDYFPVVIAAVEALLDKDSQLYSIQTATNTTAPLIVVNGPIAEKLDINSRGNVFGPGWRANATIGRAVQLVLRNIGGDIAGETDMSTHGQAGKFTACIAEAEKDSPWTPFHVDAGFAASDSTVTVIGTSAGHNVFTYGCETGQEILDHLIGAMIALGHNNIIFPTGPMLVLSPEHAATLARDGIDKKAIQRAVFERARIPLSRFGERSVKGLLHRRGRWFAEAGDPNHIGVADRPEDVHIFVAGGAGIHSLFVPTAFSYRPVTRRIAR